MPSRNHGNPEYPSDRFDFALRFVGGATFGLVVVAVVYFLAAEEFRTLVLIGGALLTPACGLLAGWLRGEFWAWVRDLFRG